MKLIPCECGCLPSCEQCLGRGLFWEDGVAMTVCPGNAPGDRKSCGRTLNRKCNGCGRPRDQCGDENDRKHTRAMVLAEISRRIRSGEA